MEYFIVRKDNTKEKIPSNSIWLSVSKEGFLQFTEPSSATFLLLNEKLYKISGSYVQQNLKMQKKYETCFIGVR